MSLGDGVVSLLAIKPRNSASRRCVDAGVPDDFPGVTAYALSLRYTLSSTLSHSNILATVPIAVREIIRDKSEKAERAPVGIVADTTE